MFHFLQLQNMPIFEQLQLEEALLRSDDRNWCIINQGSPPAIVMGISGKAEQHVNDLKYNEKPIPLIKRFSGGGTVIVDENSCFVTWICNKKSIAHHTPKEILEWSEGVYKPLFQDLPFQLRENDYVLADRKFGGNAQYLRKDRWLLHSTLLWDYDEENMDYLLMPPKMPGYRERRPHHDFLCRLKDHFPNCSRTQFIDQLSSHLNQSHPMQPADLSAAGDLISSPHVRTTRQIGAW